MQGGVFFGVNRIQVIHLFPICDKKDFEIFLILSMIVIFALILLSSSILVVLDLITYKMMYF